jgi:hypothetical protein
VLHRDSDIVFSELRGSSNLEVDARQNFQGIEKFRSFVTLPFQG